MFWTNYENFNINDHALTPALNHLSGNGMCRHGIKFILRPNETEETKHGQLFCEKG